MKITVNPKTSEWILKQSWLPQFINNCINEDVSPAKILHLLLGGYEVDTIYEAFIWTDTPEDSIFWASIDKKMNEACKREDWHDSNTTIEI